MSHGDQGPGRPEAPTGQTPAVGSPDDGGAQRTDDGVSAPTTSDPATDEGSRAVAIDEVSATPGSGQGTDRAMPATDMPSDPGTNAEPRDPWERFGWIMSSIWLLFLGFPIAGAVAADASVAARVATIAMVLVFGGVYLLGFVRATKFETWAESQRDGLIHLAVMVALILLTTPILGIGALGLTTFIVAFSMFLLKLTWAVTISVITVAVTVGAPVLTGTWPETGFFTLIVLMVAGVTVVVRVLTDRGHRHQRAVDELRLVAERDRMARDVHDVLGHSLTVISMKAELADRLIESDPQLARAELTQIQSMSREALAEIRATIAGLRVARLVDELRYADGALADAAISAELPEDATVVDPRHRIVLAWVLREAVTNVVRHARASRCQVHLDSSLLQVADDGIGTNGHPRGQGLRGVQERVRAAGGTLSIGPGLEGRGTMLTVDLDPERSAADEH